MRELQIRNQKARARRNPAGNGENLRPTAADGAKERFLSSPDLYRRIFLVGSGFSKSFCPEMPTIKDLNSRIPDGIHAECQTLRHYCYWLRELCHGAPEYLNIESVATNILTAQIFPSEEERLRNAELRFELL